ncbi:hypothetical protein XENTR_v10010569 [Xenopus tropicalis]|nr:hypothetical protein XENTR_v10010569 [Xenopus tropicalis]
MGEQRGGHKECCCDYISEFVMVTLSCLFQEKSSHIFLSKVENLEKGVKCNSFYRKRQYGRTPPTELCNGAGIICICKSACLGRYIVWDKGSLPNLSVRHNNPCAFWLGQMG